MPLSHYVPITEITIYANFTLFVLYLLPVHCSFVSIENTCFFEASISQYFLFMCRNVTHSYLS